MPHIHEKIDYTAEVFIVYNNRVLLRVHDKYGFWMSVGGHVELDEDPNQAAIREAREEVGLQIKLYDGSLRFRGEDSRSIELIPPVFMNRNRISETHEHVTFFYFAAAETDRIPVDAIKEKMPETKWFSADELDDPAYGIRESIKFYAKEALRRLAA